MRIVSDKHAEVVRHYRTIQIEEGPTIDCGGTGEYENYHPGTLITVDTLKIEWLGSNEPVTVEVSGPYVGKPHFGKERYSRRYRISDGLPDWVKEILQ
jgi:hypothetical protein